MIIELHKTTENAADAMFSLMELKDQLAQIQLDQISGGVRIDVKISSLAIENGEYEECKKCPLGGWSMRHYRTKFTKKLAVKVQMRILGFFWIDIKTFDSDDLDFDVLEAEELIEKLNE